MEKQTKSFCSRKRLKAEKKQKLSTEQKGFLKSANTESIQEKEKHYSELTFHYWFWKNNLKDLSDNTWVGFCQKRRLWLKSRNENLEGDLKEIILQNLPVDWNSCDSIICEPIKLGTKLMKLIKRGWRNLIRNPKLIFGKKEKLPHSIFGGIPSNDDLHTIKGIYGVLVQYRLEWYIKEFTYDDKPLRKNSIKL